MLHISDLSFSYQSGPGSGAHADVLQDINLHVRAGEKLALVGANGSGKSTLLLQVAGCLTPTAGRIVLHGEDCTADPRRAGRHLGILFQRQECQLLLPSVREELLLSLEDSPLSRDERLERVHGFALDFGISHLLDRAAHRLSGGEQQRVALGTLLIACPSLLVLDEPTAALDPQARRRLIDFVRELDLAVLVATHDLDFALRVTTRTVLLADGRLVADGASLDLLRDDPLLRAHGLELPLCLQAFN